MFEKKIYSEITKSLGDIIGIPSVKSSPEENAPFGLKTKQALDFILDLGRKYGFKCKDIDGYAGYIEFEGKSEKQVAILCHLDVVPAGKGWKTDPFAAVFEKDRITGRGSADDKGPAIACLYAMKDLKDSGYVPPCNIRLIVGLDEESGSLCMEYYRKKEKDPDIGFTPDAKFPVIYAEKGVLQIICEAYFETENQKLNLLSLSGGEKANMIPAECFYSCSSDENGKIAISKNTVRGIPGHASLPEYGENAISLAMKELFIMFRENKSSHPIIDFFNECIKLETNGKSLGIDFSDEKSGELTCNVGMIEFDGQIADITFDIRYPVSTDSSLIISKMENRMKKYGFTIKKKTELAPLYMDPKSDFIKILLDVYNSETGSQAKPISIGGGTYARAVPNIVAFGPNFRPEDDVPHQSGEYIKYDDLFLCFEIYKSAIQKLCEYIS